MPSVIPSNYDCSGQGLPQEDQEERAKFSGSQCAQRSLNPCAPEFISRRSPENHKEDLSESDIYAFVAPDRRKKAATLEGRNATEVR